MWQWWTFASISLLSLLRPTQFVVPYCQLFRVIVIICFDLMFLQEHSESVVPGTGFWLWTILRVVAVNAALLPLDVVVWVARWGVGESW